MKRIAFVGIGTLIIYGAMGINALFNSINKKDFKNKQDFKFETTVVNQRQTSHGWEDLNSMTEYEYSIKRKSGFLGGKYVEKLDITNYSLELGKRQSSYISLDEKNHRKKLEGIYIIDNINGTKMNLYKNMGFLATLYTKIPMKEKRKVRKYYSEIFEIFKEENEIKKKIKDYKPNKRLETEIIGF
jgi:hypothetical protein